MATITTFLTFQDRAEEAVNFYVSLFDNSKILSTTRLGEAESATKGNLTSATFQLEGQIFMALNGGATFSFCQGISLFVGVESQAELDRLWNALTESGEEGPCGWLTDRFGVSWQIVPARLAQMLADPNRKKAQAVLEEMLQMRKLDFAKLQAAYDAV